MPLNKDSFKKSADEEDYHPGKMFFMSSDETVNMKIFDNLILNINNSLTTHDRCLYLQYCLITILYFYFRNQIKIDNFLSIKFEYKDCLSSLLITSIFALSIYSIFIQYFFLTRHRMVYYYLKLKYKYLNEYFIPHSVYRCSFLTVFIDVSFYGCITVIQKIFMTISHFLFFLIETIPIQLSAILVVVYKENFLNSYFFYIFLAIVVLILVVSTSLIIIAKNEKAI